MDVTRGGGARVSAGKGWGKLNFKVKEIIISAEHIFVIEPNKKKFWK